MRLLVLVLAGLLLLIQWPLWFGKGGWLRAAELQRQVDTQRAVNGQLAARSEALAAACVTPSRTAARVTLCSCSSASKTRSRLRSSVSLLFSFISEFITSAFVDDFHRLNVPSRSSAGGRNDQR